MIEVRIRHRWRFQASPKEGLRQSWGEYQVVLGRKVIFRADLFTQAASWAKQKGYKVVSDGR